MPLARLELAPRVNPDWILSPTRLPIPPQGHADYLIFIFLCCGIDRLRLPPLSQNLTFSQLLFGRVPQGHADYLIFIFSAAESVDYVYLPSHKT